MPSHRLLPIPLAAALLAAAPAHAAEKLNIRGAGWGHGVGMSQYGAYGFAKQGAGYRDIVGHYYTGTQVSQAPPQKIRVLLFSSSSASFTGARSAGGRKLNPAKVYRAVRAGTNRVSLVSPAGKRMRTVTAPLRARGKILTTNGERFRGAFEFRPGTFSGIDTINAVGLEKYLRGVVARESPASWPLEALKAQALAARSYAITTKRSGTFDAYKDTRSQVYGGVAAEDPRTDRAIRETRGEVVTYGGRPVVTFFFSTSGGRTEDVENTSLGNAPVPWLKSVEDPYDKVSPYHRWSLSMTHDRAGSLLGSLVKGRFVGIRVIQRGSSPRIVRADVVGTDGTSRTDGATLRARLGLRDTWAYFTSVQTSAVKPRSGARMTDHAAAGPGGGASAVRRSPAGAVAGRVFPRPRADVRVQRRTGKRWVLVGTTRTGKAGRYRLHVLDPGVYRVRAGQATGPAVRVR
jgi:stage II sporulation protein D